MDGGIGGTAVRINDDGGVTIEPVRADPPADAAFDENLAERCDSGALASIAQDLLGAVRDDESSRQEWISNYRKILDLLGLKVEDVTATKAQKRNVSRLNHPLLLEAVVKAQGLARAELLPAGGPVKVRTRSGDDAATDDLALALEQDMNAYLTVGAPEYVPEMDRGLFGVFLGGNLFKKVYFHPLKRRPVAEVIDVEDMIVSQGATDLDTAPRVTHRARLAPNLVRRMQVFGDWLDVALPPGGIALTGDQIRRKKDEVSGVAPIGLRPQDQPYTVYEVTTDLDFGELGIAVPGAPDDLPLPAVVTIEEASGQVLCLRRGWREGDEQFRRRQRFVHYGMVPGLDFLCLGYGHLLGNQTRALTAAWRLICDAGMFANFPGGVRAKGVRLSTNEVAPSPGEFVDVDLNGIDDIRKVLMPFPYKDPSPTFIQFIELVGANAEKLAGTTQIESGEGRTNIPVGTMMSMVEQSTQVSAVVHKRLHTAQALELLLLKECVAENPEAICAVIPTPARRWVGALEFGSVDLLPASDPNVPSQTHRVMLATAMVQMASQNPDIYDKLRTHQRAWRTVGVTDTNDFLHAQPPPPMPPPQANPQLVAAQAQQVKAQADMVSAQGKIEDSHRKAAGESVEVAARTQEAQAEASAKQQQANAQLQMAGIQAETERLRMASEAAKLQREQMSGPVAPATPPIGVGP